MGTAISPSEIKRFEVTEVYAHPEAKVDIVLVHGLNGDPQKTWTAKNGVFWPSQLLPVSLKSAKARVLVYGYNADVYAFGGEKSASSDMIHAHAQSLVSSVALERKSEETTGNAIVWVAHSLGGILVKRALELSNDLSSKSADDNRNIFVSTFGIIFLGTPHTGADPAKWGIILQGMVSSLVPKKMMDSESQLVRTLQTNNETLQNINLHFLDIYQRFKICMVHESVKSDLKGTRMFIVDQLSASPLLPDVQYFGIEATHSGMCKFESKNSPGYLNISATIKGWVEESPKVIQARLDMERRTRQQAHEAQAKELLGIFDSQVHSQAQGSSGQQTPDLSKSGISYHSVASIEPDTQGLESKEPYFIKPPGFRPNSLFVGREAELAEMHKLLFDKKRRADGTSAVLIQSMPGGGKTHLAREFVYQHKDEYPGGVFWIRAKTLPELAAGYWDIARNAALKGSSENLSMQDPEQFIKLVRNWLNQRQDWLLVLDGLHFDDPETLVKYIPDSPNTGIIYTSTVKYVSNDYQFMNPEVIRLPLLSAKEAQTLLLQELNKKDPSRDDLLHSMELVQAMGFLPVVIHAVAQRLKATDEPLSKFARHYSAEPKLRGLGAYTAVVDQLEMLGAIEALNLLRIMCFFSQHIPVEMLVLGLKALDIPVKASEPISGRSLNNTFKMLNSFALIERNEPEPLHSSQSSKGSRDMIGDHVDVVRLHSVVESFFVDTLLSEGTLPLWLDRAVRVFCCSYDSAADRIARKNNSGLVEDYRLYEIHGNKLREHVVRYLKKSTTLEQTLVLLDGRLEAIKSEIERRTPESSQCIAGGKPEAFQISIFDRTSSSSDTGPESPGFFDKYSTGVSTWGLEVDKAQMDSPVSIKSITHDTSYGDQPQVMPKAQFPPPQAQDDGYDTDMDESSAMTVQPSQRTIRQEDSPISPGAAWETVGRRRPKMEPVKLDIHRTIKTMEKQRYRDSVGAFRSASDPRVTREFAQGFLHRNNTRARSRSKMSGQSQAEVALTHLTQTSPPPVRGGGMIQDRQRSSSERRSQDRSRLVAGSATYAAAVSGATRDTIVEPRELERPATDSTATRYSSSDTQPSSIPPPMTTSAMASLQKIPHERRVPTTVQSSPREPPTPMPPYPPSPGPYLSYRLPYPSSDTDLYGLGGGSTYSQENLTLGPDPYAAPNVYPRMTAPLPHETLSKSPKKRELPHDYLQWHSQQYPNLATVTTLAAAHYDPNLSGETPDFLSFSSPNFTRPTYFNSNNSDGYTSQPMSRNPSDQTPYNHRRPSLAETEPLPQLPTFLPRIAPTSYQVYERMKERDRVQRTNMTSGPTRKSPRLDFARAALISNLEEWPENEPLPELVSRGRTFNPNAPSFSPRASSLHSNITRQASPASANSSPHYQSPVQPQVPYPTPEMGIEGDGGVAMGRSGSGGLRVGRQLIGFGDFPELVDPVEARERVRGAWAEREAASSLTGLGIGH